LPNTASSDDPLAVGAVVEEYAGYFQQTNFVRSWDKARGGSLARILLSPIQFTNHVGARLVAVQPTHENVPIVAALRPDNCRALVRPTAFANTRHPTGPGKAQVAIPYQIQCVTIKHLRGERLRAVALAHSTRHLR